MAQVTTSQGSHRQVKIHIKDVHSREAIPERTLQLLAPSFEATIGRGSQTESHLNPQEGNGWFSSRVMSRTHAMIRVDPNTRTMTLEDQGSMHGTYVEGGRVVPGHPVQVFDHDRIQFGQLIVRGDQVYKALEVTLGLDWEDDLPLAHQTRLQPSYTSKNSFSVDYSEEELEDDDIELVYESIRIPSAEAVGPARHSRTFSVPDSDHASDSDVDQTKQDESAPSSPTESHLAECQKPLSPAKVTLGKYRDAAPESLSQLPGSDVQNALNVDTEDEELQSVDGNGAPTGDIEDVNTFSENDCVITDYDAESDSSDMDDYDEEEQEENIFNENTSHLFGTFATQTQNNQFPRLPSPSDCAMPKPAWHPQPGNLPAIQDLVEQAPSQSTSLAHGFQLSQPPQLSQFQPYYGGINWASNDGSTNFQALCNNGLHLPTMTNVSLDSTLAAQSCMVFAVPEVVKSAEEIELPCSRGSVMAKSSKVSIHDIIDDTRSTASSSNRKRKADEISCLTSEEGLATISGSRTQAPALFDTPSTSESSLNAPKELTSELASEALSHNMSNTGLEETSSSRNLTTSAANVIVADSDRPRKKPKVHGQPSSSNVFKYLAAAIAGATVGAVGTVFGLAALPAEYFV